MKKDDKTNVMRILDQKKLEYVPHGFEVEEGAPCDAVTVAGLIGKDVSEVYKTLVLKAGKGNFYVFVVPGAASLIIKKPQKPLEKKALQWFLLPIFLLLPDISTAAVPPLE